MQAHELPAFFEALALELNQTAQDYIMISLLTGVRKSNALAMRWKDIDFTTKTWKIQDTKNGESHFVPLMPQAIELLKIRKINFNSKWIFEGLGKTGHLQDPKKAWKRIPKKAGIRDLRIHDLRRTLGSWNEWPTKFKSPYCQVRVIL